MKCKVYKSNFNRYILFSFINLCIIHVESIRTRRKELFLIRNKKKKGMIANKKAQYSTSMHFE